MNTNVNTSSFIGKPTTIQEVNIFACSIYKFLIIQFRFFSFFCNFFLKGIDRTVFREILHNTFDIVTENTLMDRIFCVWDKQNYGLITLENWLDGLSLFLKGNVTKQVEFCFAVYDLNSDGFITKDEMFQLLKYRFIHT